MIAADGVAEVPVLARGSVIVTRELDRTRLASVPDCCSQPAG
mgnify:CR=1 FL=1